MLKKSDFTVTKKNRDELIRESEEIAAEAMRRRMDQIIAETHQTKRMTKAELVEGIKKEMSVLLASSEQLKSSKFPMQELRKIHGELHNVIAAVRGESLPMNLGGKKRQQKATAKDISFKRPTG